MKRLYSLIFALILCNFYPVLAQVNIYVDANLSSEGDGKSWATAYKDLNKAINFANENSGKYDIHVAQGTYKPSQVSLRGNPVSSDNVTYTVKYPEPITDNISLAFKIYDVAVNGAPVIDKVEYNYKNVNVLSDRDAAFAVKRSGIRIFGGYPSGGGARNIASYPTILDGNLGTAGKAYHIMILGRGEDNVIVSSSDSIVVDGITFQNANANGTATVRLSGYGILQNQGGALLNMFDSKSGKTEQVSIRNCTFRNNNADFGAGIFNQGCNGSIKNCTFQSNSVTKGGGAIYNSICNPEITDCKFISNSSQFFAGAIFNQESNARITNCSFTTNTSTQTAGALYNLQGSPNISNCTFTKNTAKEAGAIRNDKASVTINTCTFTENNVTDNAGAILNYISSLSISNSTFNKNHASKRAGAIWFRKTAGSGISISNSTFDGNYTTTLNDFNNGLGGAFLADSSANPTFTNTILKNNSAFRAGVIFNQINTTATFNNCTFEKNTANYAGGVAYIEQTNTINLNNCKVIQNTCTSTGSSITGFGPEGSIFLVANKVNASTDGTLNANSTLFKDNSVPNSKYGVVLNIGNATIKNCVFTGNSCNQYGANVFASSNNTNILSCTMYNNKTTDNYDMGIYCSPNCSVTVRNSILWDGNYSLYSHGTATVSNSDIRGYEVFPGTSNIMTWPGFVNINDLDGPDDIFGTYDDGLNISTSSQCANAGNNTYATGITTDFAGNPRLNGTIDMGAYESLTITPANALTFENGLRYINIPHFNRPSSYTFEARINTTNTNNQTLVKWSNSANSSYTSITINSGKLSFTDNTSANANYSVVGKKSVNDGKWHHVAVVRDATNNQVILYVDGAEDASVTNAQAASVSNQLNLGEKDLSFLSYVGQIDEVRFWDRAVCAGELNANKACEISGTPTTLAAYYKFNQGNSGASNVGLTTLTDASGKSRNGTLTNFDLSGNNTWTKTESGVSGTCSAYSVSNITASNNGPFTSGNTLSLTTSDGFTSYKWTGPNGFTSLVQNPTITQATTAASGAYSVTAYLNGCSSNTATTNVTINAIPPTAASALAFDNGNQINVPHMQLGSEYTIETMFKSSNTGNPSSIVAWSGTENVSLYVQENGTLLFYRTNGGSPEYSNIPTPINLYDDAWHHLAVTVKQDKTITIYIDGNQVHSYSGFFSSPATSNLTVGTWPGYFGFKGQLDEFRVWNTALCASEISNNKSCEISPSTTGLQIYYRFNQGNDSIPNPTVTTVTDLAGGNQNGTLVGFSLAGKNSNWVLASGTGKIASGISCTPYNRPNLNNITGKSVVIANGDVTPSTTDDTEFGEVNKTTSASKTFTISNNGSGVLDISSITLSGADASFFSVTNAPTSVAANSTATFTVNFNPANSTVLKSATVNVNTSDCRNPKYTFAVSGIGITVTPGAALDFDGLNDYAAVGSFSLGNTFTYEAKIKSTSNNVQAIISHVDPSMGTGSRTLQLYGGYLQYFEQSNTAFAYAVSSVKVNDGNWHHVAVIRNAQTSNNVSLYIDGVNVTNGTANISIAPSNLNLGQVYGGYFFQGSLDEVRIWNRALCGSEISSFQNCEVSNTSSNLSAYYKFNQGNAATNNLVTTLVTDATANAKNLTLFNFTLNGANSNFISPGGVVTGTNCGALVQPNIVVTSSTNVTITNNDVTPSTTDATDMGNVDIDAGAKVTSFTIKNTGTNSLVLSGSTKVIVTGTGFSLAQDAASPIAATSGTSTFNVAFDPSTVGAQTGTVTIYSNDCNNPVYTFSISGTGYGGPPTAAALNFDGVDDYVVIPGVVSSDFTVEFMLNTTMTGQTGPDWYYGNGIVDAEIGGITNDFGLALVGDKIGFGVGNPDVSIFSTTSVNSGAWVHVAATWSQSTGKMQLYINGILEATGTSGTALRSVPRIILGRLQTDLRPFIGSLDEVRIYNYALCGSEIYNHRNKELGNASSGLLAYFPMNQGQNGGLNPGQTTLKDASGKGNNGTLNNFTLNGTTSNFIAPGGVVVGSIAPAFKPSEISISGNGVEIVNNDNTPSTADNTDFGNVQSAAGSKTQTFVVSSLGLGKLAFHNPKVTVTGTGFSIGTNITIDSLASGSTVNFTVTYTPAANGVNTGSVTIMNNDCDESSYTFAIKGTGFTPPPSTSFKFSDVNYNGNNINLGTRISDSLSGTSALTIEAWVNITSLEHNGYIISNYRTGYPVTDQYTFALRREGGGVGLIISTTNGSYSIGGPVGTIGEWKHLAFTWDGKNLKYYVNGELVSSKTDAIATGLGVLTKPVVIGNTTVISPAMNFKGEMDEIRIWKRALCQEEINNRKDCELPSNSIGLLAYYKFNEGYAYGINTSNNTIKDYSGNGIDGTIGATLSGNTSNWSGGSVVNTGTTCSPYSPPIIVLKGNSATIQNNDITPSVSDNTDFGYVATNTSKNLNFEVFNIGTLNPLLLSGVKNITVSGTGFSLVTDAAASIAFGANSMFTIKYEPTSEGVHTGTVVIYSNDCLNPVYTFKLKGSSVPARALQLDGVDDYVNLGAGIGTNLIGTNKVTVEAWVKPTSISGFGVILGNYNTSPQTSGTDFKFLLRRNGSNYAFYVGDQQNTTFKEVVAGSSVTLNTWQHVVGVWNGSDIRIYVDGVLKGTTTGVTGASFNNTNSNEFWIGKNAINENFAGYIDEVRVWDRDLCISEIKHNKNFELALPQTGLLAYYQFNQGGDTTNNSTINTLTDISGNAINGTILNMARTGTGSNFVANGAVVAGSSAGLYFPAEIEVLSNNVVINNNDSSPSISDNTDFGDVFFEGENAVNRIFTIKNTGNEVLNLTGSPRVAVTGSGFSLVNDAPSTIEAGSSATFEVSFDPSTATATNGSISIANDDCDEFNYTFSIKGTGKNAIPANALHFDGVDDFVAITNPFYQYGKEITVEWNVNVESSTMGSGISQGTSNVDNPSTNVWMMHLLPDRGIFFLANPNAGGGAASAPSLAPGWHKIVGVATKEYTHLYVDGVLVGRGSGYAGAKITNNPASQIHFGKDVRYNTTRFFKGSMDEVRIWNRALSKNEILTYAMCERKTASNYPKSLVGYYKFNQGIEQADNSAIITLIDSSKYAKNGSLNNFTLTGKTSNWIISSPIVTGDYCPPCEQKDTNLTVSECTGSYTSPSGNYVWTASGIYKDTLTSDLGCDSILTIDLTIQNIDISNAVSPISSVICSPSETKIISVENSTSDVSYSLINSLTKEQVGASVIGNGNTISFNTGTLTTKTEFVIKASASGCEKMLTNKAIVNVSSKPNASYIVTGDVMRANAVGVTYQWVDCANAYAPLLGATLDTFKTTGTGNFALTVTNFDGCRDTSTCFEFIKRTPASALRFDGVNDYVNIGNAIATSIVGTNTITVEAWVRPTSTSGLGVIVGDYNTYPVTSSTAFKFLLRRNGASYGFYVGDEQNQNFKEVTSPNVVVLNTWQHVVGVWNGSDIKIYVDGVLQGTRTGVTGASFNNLNSNEFWIGKNAINENFKGDIDEIRIWKTALTQTEIQNKKNCEIHEKLPELIANYHFNQGDSAYYNTNVFSLIDSSGNNNVGILNNFELKGNTSNWISPGAMKNGAACYDCSQIDRTVTQSGDNLIANFEGASYQWINCLDNSLVGETNRIFTPESDGDYAVIITKGVCEDTSSCTNVLVTTLNQNEYFDKITIHPNPVENGANVSVTIDGDEDSKTFQLINANGIVVSPKMTKDEIEAKEFSIPSGMYLVKVVDTNSDNVRYIKLIVR